jgi:hypothetical protein
MEQIATDETPKLLAAFWFLKSYKETQFEEWVWNSPRTVPNRQSLSTHATAQDENATVAS